MKTKLFFLLLLSFPFICSCSDDYDNNKYDDFFMKPMTMEELENTGTSNSEKKDELYIWFEDGVLRYLDESHSGFFGFYNYTINGDSISITKDNKTYSLFLNLVHWSDDNEQLLFRGDNFPYYLSAGYYDEVSKSKP